MRRHHPAIMALAAGLLLLGGGAWAGTTGKIAGRVTDAQTGEALPGVNVVIEGTTMGAATDVDGYYVILSVPPGTYVVSAQMIGYRVRRVENVRVSADMTATVHFQLEPTVLELGKEVTVVAERPVVQMDRTSSLASVQADEIRVLPVEEMTDVLELQAGLVRDAYGGLHIRGGRSGEVAYWVDGIAATDVYNGQMGIDVENAAIQELQVISGTFNAEYGQALSGIVNIVTKEGSSKFTGQVQAYAGDYLSFDDKTYFVLKPKRRAREALYSPNPDSLERINPLEDLNPIYDLQVSLSGPLPRAKTKGTFFVNFRRYSSDGYLYGLRWFTPQGLLADGKIVPMNPYQKSSFQGKLAYRLTPELKLTYTLLWNANRFRYYDHYFKYNPDALYRRFEDGTNHILAITHTLSPKTFYELKLTRFSTGYKHYLYEDPKDAVAYIEHVDPADTTRKWYTIDPKDAVGYVHPDSLYAPAPWSFSDGGTPAQHFNRSTSYWVTKFDLTSQVTRNHQVKAGLEARFHRVEMTDFSVVPKRVGNTDVIPFQPAIPERISPNYNAFANRPIEFSAYVQDKMEFRDVIVNLGVRFDYFYPDAKVLADPTDPNIYDPFKPEHRYKNWSATTPESLLVEYTVAEREKFWWKKASAKMQLSPRFGIAYPITDRGVIHFSYGHFFQMPQFEYLYGEIEVPRTSGVSTLLHNPDLKPQRTVMYELGLQQQIAEDIGVDVTMFYRDIRDWVGTGPPIQTSLPSVVYTRFENKDYANVRGVTVSVDKRYRRYFEANLYYTYQVAEGSASNPSDEYFDRLANRAPRIQLIPLAWDQRHTLNGTISVGTSTWRVSLIGRYWSGKPYTPRFPVGTVAGGSAFVGLRENSARRPAVNSFDLRIYKQFRVRGMGLAVFANVYNVFDQRSPTNVYEDTGSPYYTLDVRAVGADPHRVSTLEDNARHPEWFIEPRQLQLGVALSF